MPFEPQSEGHSFEKGGRSGRLACCTEEDAHGEKQIDVTNHSGCCYWVQNQNQDLAARWYKMPMTAPAMPKKTMLATMSMTTSFNSKMWAPLQV